MSSANIIEFHGPADRTVEGWKQATSPESLKQIKDEHKAAQTHATRAVEHAIRCGQLLLEAKALLGHGNLSRYIEQRCRIPYSTAARYMRAARLNLSGVEISSLSSVFGPARPKAKRVQPPAGSAMTAAPVSPVTSDRAATLEALKVRITEYANAYGWDAAQMDLGSWIEGQAQPGIAETICTEAAA